MKKIISLIISLSLILSAVLSCFTSFASTKPHVEDALVSLQKQSGYIPGKTAAVQNNCFAFISSVCKKLYGVSYEYEQQSGNYKFNHTNNYFTVAEKVIPYSSSSSKITSNAKALKSWLLENAAVGDILQYGSADSSYSKKHTVIIQHIDSEKLQVYHSNYATSGISASACRVDTLYWDSFISSPFTNIRDSSGNITSLNYLFGSSMKLTQGMGISINRYAFLEQKYQLDTASKYTSKITKTERASSTSIKIYYKAIENAQCYCVQYRKSDSSDWTTATSSATATNYTVKKLTTGESYCFRVSACVNGVWKDYSTEAVKTVLPPKPANISLSYTNAGTVITWAARSDITGVIVYRSSNKSGSYTAIADISKSSGNSFTDSDVSAGKTYYYKIVRYLDKNNNRYESEASSAVKSTYMLDAPASFKAAADTKSTAKLSWKAVAYADHYTIAYCKNGSNKYKYAYTSSTKITIKGLSLNSTYYFYVLPSNSFGNGNSSSASLKIKPKKPTVTLKKSGKSVKITWSKVSGVSGYKIYRSTSKNGKKTLIKTVKGNKKFSYTDKTVKSKKTYYYTVKSYVNKNKKTYYGYSSAAKKTRI